MYLLLVVTLLEIQTAHAHEMCDWDVTRWEIKDMGLDDYGIVR